MFHTFGVGELALLVKLQKSTKLRQPRTMQVYVPPFCLCFFNFIPVRTGLKFPIYEQTTKFVSVTRPARLPGSYEETLGQCLDEMTAASTESVIRSQRRKRPS